VLSACVVAIANISTKAAAMIAASQRCQRLTDVVCEGCMGFVASSGNYERDRRRGPLLEQQNS
jgi:hypothetical protein